MLPWLWRWVKRAVGAVLFLAVFLVAFGIGYEQWSRFRVPRTHPAPGARVAVNDAALHLNCRGSGSPTVILEAALTGFGSLHWFAVQPEVQKFARVCSYDRAGIMWSDSLDEPRTAARMVDELYALLVAARVSPPYVMVGHSFGGLLTRLYDQKYAGEVVGFVFVDSSHPDQQRRLPSVEGAGGPPPTWALSLFTGTGLVRLMPASQSPRIPTVVKETVQAYSPHSTHGMFAEIRSIDASTAEAASLTNAAGSLGSRPVVVLTRGVFDADPPGTREAWTDMQNELASLSADTDHRVVERATHNIQIDAPDAVVRAIRDVVSAERAAAPVARLESAPR